MKVSVVTVCYNSAGTVEQTIVSVLGQDYPDVEYVVIDGASTDGTVQIIDKHRDRIHKFVSEPDKGLYDALNKGIRLASGDVIGFLHADDLFAGPRVLSAIMAKFSNDIDAVYGDLDYVDSADTSKVIRAWRSGPYRKGAFVKGWMPPHPTLYVRKEMYEQYGNFTLQLRSASDYELMLRLIHRHQVRLAYLPEVVVKMRVGGMSNQSLKARIKAFIEDLKAWKINGYGLQLLPVIRKKAGKLTQWL